MVRHEKRCFYTSLPVSRPVFCALVERLTTSRLELAMVSNTKVQAGEGNILPWYGRSALLLPRHRMNKRFPARQCLNHGSARGTFNQLFAGVSCFLMETAPARLGRSLALSLYSALQPPVLLRRSIAHLSYLPLVSAAARRKSNPPVPTRHMQQVIA